MLYQVNLHRGLKPKEMEPRSFKTSIESERIMRYLMYRSDFNTGLQHEGYVGG